MVLDAGTGPGAAGVVPAAPGAHAHNTPPNANTGSFRRCIHSVHFHQSDCIARATSTPRKSSSARVGNNTRHAKPLFKLGDGAQFGTSAVVSLIWIQCVPSYRNVFERLNPSAGALQAVP